MTALLKPQGRDRRAVIAYPCARQSKPKWGMMMSRELMWLTMTVILTGVLWIPYILDRIVVRGLMGAMANPSRNDTPQSPWAQRLYFAHTNAVENLVIFAPLVLILDAHRPFDGKHRASPARSISGRGWRTSIVYTLGIPVLRTLAFAAGFVAQVVLVVAIFGEALVQRRGPLGNRARDRPRAAACRRRRRLPRRAATRRRRPPRPAARA